MKTIPAKAPAAADPKRADHLLDAQDLKAWVLHSSDSAFENLVRRHGPALHATCHRILGPGQTADDAVQAVWLVFSRHARSIRQADAVSAWLHRCAVMACRQTIRSEAARRQREAKVAATERFRTATEARPDTMTDHQDLNTHLDEAIASLPDSKRHVLIRHFLWGHSLTDIASSLKISPNAVLKRRDRALLSLRRWFKKRGMIMSVSLPAIIGELPACDASHALVSPHAIPSAAVKELASAIEPGLLGSTIASTPVLAGLAFTLASTLPLLGMTQIDSDSAETGTTETSKNLAYAAIPRIAEPTAAGPNHTDRHLEEQYYYHPQGNRPATLAKLSPSQKIPGLVPLPSSGTLPAFDAIPAETYTRLFQEQKHQLPNEALSDGKFIPVTKKQINWLANLPSHLQAEYERPDGEDSGKKYVRQRVIFEGVTAADKERLHPLLLGIAAIPEGVVLPTATTSTHWIASRGELQNFPLPNEDDIQDVVLRIFNPSARAPQANQ